MDLARSIGVDLIIDYTKEDFTKKGPHYRLFTPNAFFQKIRPSRTTAMDRPATLAAAINLGISRSNTVPRSSSRDAFPLDWDNGNKRTKSATAIGEKGRLIMELLLARTEGRGMEISSSLIKTKTDDFCCPD
jgi:hypothetical protein